MWAMWNGWFTAGLVFVVWFAFFWWWTRKHELRFGRTIDAPSELLDPDPSNPLSIYSPVSVTNPPDDDF